MTGSGVTHHLTEETVGYGYAQPTLRASRLYL
jgi:hypothetical protein